MGEKLSCRSEKPLEMRLVRYGSISGQRSGVVGLVVAWGKFMNKQSSSFAKYLLVFPCELNQELAVEEVT